jgi:undecaprenyl-diphosphatase
MYLGVHTPLDVGVSLLIGAALTFLLYPVFKNEERFEKFMPIVIGISLLLAALFMLYFPLWGNKAAHDAVNLASGMKNAYTLTGCTVGLAIVYFVDSTFIKFDTGAAWYAQILKLALGLGGVLLIKSGLSSPLVALFGNEYIARMIRYLLIVLFAGIVWPLTFKLFSKLRIGALDRFGNRVRSVFCKKQKEN